MVGKPGPSPSGGGMFQGDLPEPSRAPAASGDDRWKSLARLLAQRTSPQQFENPYYGEMTNDQWNEIMNTYLGFKNGGVLDGRGSVTIPSADGKARAWFDLTTGEHSLTGKTLPAPPPPSTPGEIFWDLFRGIVPPAEEQREPIRLSPVAPIRGDAPPPNRAPIAELPAQDPLLVALRAAAGLPPLDDR